MSIQTKEFDEKRRRLLPTDPLSNRRSRGTGRDRAPDQSGDALLFLQCVLTLCSIEQRAELKRRLIEHDAEGLMRAIRPIVATECKPQIRWAFSGTDSGIDH
jgi:hypothetical protein